jgi:hypothetical protein
MYSFKLPADIHNKLGQVSKNPIILTLLKEEFPFVVVIVVDDLLSAILG